MIIGLDPGTKGGLAILAGDGQFVYAMGLEKLTESEVVSVLSEHLTAWKMTPTLTVRAFLEKVNATPKAGSSASFKFGASYGFLRGVLHGLEIPFEDVQPKAWRKTVGLGAAKGSVKVGFDDDGGGAAYAARKKASRAKAQQLFPNIKVTNAIADALLIAEHGVRREVG